MKLQQLHEASHISSNTGNQGYIITLTDTEGWVTNVWGVFGSYDQAQKYLDQVGSLFEDDNWEHEISGANQPISIEPIEHPSAGLEYFKSVADEIY